MAMCVSGSFQDISQDEVLVTFFCLLLFHGGKPAFAGREVVKMSMRWKSSCPLEKGSVCRRGSNRDAFGLRR